MSDTLETPSMGWVRDLPDVRDYTVANEKIKPLLKKLKAEDAPKAAPTSVDLAAWCSPIENQLSIGSCTAHAGVGMYEYFERRAFGAHLDCSRLFLYKVTRNLLKWSGDTGAYLRTTMGALALFGTPPESYWQYDVTKYDVEPPAFCYAFAQSYQALSFYRLDPSGTTAAALLARIKTNLAAGLPSMFGFTCYSSLGQANATGRIPYPTQGEKVVGGHAVMAVGYDDTLKIRNANPGAAETTGALKIRNSWGVGWGEQGYGWLPYEYVLCGLAVDWWSMIKGEYIATNHFGL